MKLNRVLVIVKRHIGAMASAGGARPIGAARWQHIHERACAAVVRSLENLAIPHEVINRNDLAAGLCGDLLITVGGDGTVLAAAHIAGIIPILGVNSMPGRSVGFFCAATAATFPRVIRGIADGNRAPTDLPLLAANIGGLRVPIHALNDVLFAGRSPAEMLRYEIAIGGRKECQRSSGVWIAAGPGSTAAVLAAGGRRLPIASRRLQMVVREPHNFGRIRHRLTRALLPPRASLTIIPETTDAVIFLDGPKHVFPVPARTRLTVRVATKTLSVFLR